MIITISYLNCNYYSAVLNSIKLLLLLFHSIYGGNVLSNKNHYHGVTKYPSQ